MDRRKAFYDLCVPVQSNPAKMSAILNELFEYGYRTVAIEQIYDHSAQPKKGKDLIPEPVDLSAWRSEFRQRLTLLNRLTIVYDEPIVVHAMNTSANLRRYQLVAGAPMSDAAMQHCCSTFGGDLIARCETAEGGQLRMLHVSHKYYQLAMRRGLCFEVRYAPAIVDQNLRQDTLTVAYQYASQRKARNVIISSGARDKFDVRGPYDIANLGLIFGLSEEQSKSAISHTCRRLLLKAEARLHGKTVMYAKDVQPDPDDEDEEDDEEDGEEEEEDDEDDDFEDLEDDAADRPCKKQKVTE